MNLLWKFNVFFLKCYKNFNCEYGKAAKLFGMKGICPQRQKAQLVLFFKEALEGDDFDEIIVAGSWVSFVLRL